MKRLTTIKELFQEENILFSIPPYQRAYSWEVDKDRKQVRQFLNDIKEQDTRRRTTTFDNYHNFHEFSDLRIGKKRKGRKNQK